MNFFVKQEGKKLNMLMTTNIMKENGEKNRNVVEKKKLMAYFYT